MTETLTQRIARQKAEREALKNVPTTKEDWQPLIDAENFIQDAVGHFRRVRAAKRRAAGGTKIVR